MSYAIFVINPGSAPFAKKCSVTSARVWPMKSASKGFMIASTCALLGTGAPIVLNVSTPMMPITRLFSRRAASIATGPPIEWPTRISLWLGTAASAVGAAVAGEIDRDDRVLLPELGHLLAPVVRVARPAVDQHERGLAAAVHAVLHVRAIRRDGDARRAFRRRGPGFSRGRGRGGR